MTMLEQSQQSDWLQTELESMSLPAASPARISQSQETKREYKTEREAAYGQSAPVCLGSFDLNTPSLKTSQTCLTDTGEIGLSEFSGTFPRSGMMRSGTVYQLPNLARTITEIGSGLLPTPAASTGGTTGNWWPTPLAQEAKHATPTEWEMTTNHAATQNSLRVQVNKRKVWPTPNASDNRDRGCMEDESVKRRLRIGKQVGLSTVVKDRRQSGALNPTWVEWLMGFPIGHTDLNA